MVVASNDGWSFVESEKFQNGELLALDEPVDGLLSQNATEEDFFKKFGKLVTASMKLLQS